MSRRRVRCANLFVRLLQGEVQCRSFTRLPVYPPWRAPHAHSARPHHATTITSTLRNRTELGFGHSLVLGHWPLLPKSLLLPPRYPRNTFLIPSIQTKPTKAIPTAQKPLSRSKNATFPPIPPNFFNQTKPPPLAALHLPQHFAQHSALRNDNRN